MNSPNQPKEIADVCTRDHAIAVLIKASLDAVMELDHLKNKTTPLTLDEYDRAEQIVERGHAAIIDAQRNTGGMTTDQFKTTSWMPRMAALYKGKRYQIASVCFDEALVALDGLTLGTDEPTWVRCESITLDGGWSA